MTIDQGKSVIKNYYEDKFKKVNRFTLLTDKGRKIELDYTRTLLAWEKDANLSLPKKINLTNDNGEFIIDKNGVLINNILVPWSDIVTTAIAKHNIQLGLRDFKCEYYFVGCIKSGDIFEIRIDNINKYSNLFGHFIELYKS